MTLFRNTASLPNTSYRIIAECCMKRSITAQLNIAATDQKDEEDGEKKEDIAPQISFSGGANEDARGLITSAVGWR